MSRVFLRGLLLSVLCMTCFSPVAYGASSLSWSTIGMNLENLHGEECQAGKKEVFTTIRGLSTAVNVENFFKAYALMEECMPKERRIFTPGNVLSPVLQGRSTGLMDVNLVGSELLTQEQFTEMMQRDLIIQRYKPYILRYEFGLVRSTADVTATRFSSSRDVKSIVARYDGYLSRRELPKWMRTELTEIRKKFRVLGEDLQKKEQEALQKKLQQKKGEEKPVERTTLGVPVYIQEQKLSCEMASLRSLLAFYGIEVSEKELVETLGVSEPLLFGEGIWGDPQEAFVGDITGRQGEKTGYGTYWKAVARVASSYTSSIGYFEGATMDFLTSSVAEGKPVMIWGLSDPSLGVIPIKWKTVFGESITGYVGEHSMIVYGFEGPRSAPTKILVLDPLYGKKSYLPEELDAMWVLFGRSGVRRA